MPAELESMMYYGEAPWHKQGVRLERPATAKEAIVAAGLDWEVELMDVFAFKQGIATPINCPDNRAVVRTSDQNVLGVVGQRYTPVQNNSAFDFFDSVVGAGQAIYHTAGSLRGGKRVWILAKLPNDIQIVKGDVVEPFLLLTNTHDGTSTLRMFYTPIRVVCMNTLTWALQRKQGEGVSLRHTVSIADKLEQARDVLGLATSYYDELQQVSAALAKTKATDDMIADILSACFPGALGPDSSKRQQNTIDTIDAIAAGVTGTLTPGLERTLWTYVNAIAEYVDRVRSSRSADRLNSIWFGSGRQVKQTAFEVATSMVS